MSWKHVLLSSAAALTLVVMLSACSRKPETLDQMIDRGLKVASAQALDMAKQLENQPAAFPRTVDGDTLQTSDYTWWCSGFFPGELWYLYEATGKETFRHYAEIYTKRVAPAQFMTNTHDVGFMIYNSFGNAYRITKDTSYCSAIINAANSLSTRYNVKAGVFKSWDSNSKWQYPVIIDNMMNLELLCEAYKINGDQDLYAKALSHASTTLVYQFRPTFSCYHVIDYDTITGRPRAFDTAQGYSRESAWARGQSWALYGFTMMYRESGKEDYLTAARNVAFFLMNHPRMPQDKVPYWDYDAPDIPNAKRDASSAAIMASALIELSQVNNMFPVENDGYLKFAEAQLRSLSSPQYLAKKGENHHFTLMHSVGSLPGKSEVDVPLSYADYYYVEALLRLKKALKEQPSK